MHVSFKQRAHIAAPTALAANILMLSIASQTPAYGQGISVDQLSLDGIRTFLEAHPLIDNPHDFLLALPEKFRSSYTLVTDSQTGGADHRLVTSTNPRIIIHGETGSGVPLGLIVAIIPGSKKVEIIDYQRGQFNPGLIEFRRRTPSDVGLPSSLSSAFSSHLGPCYACHSGKKESAEKDSKKAARKFRPNWESYPFWSGVLGFSDNGLGEATKQHEIRRIQEFIDHLPETETSIYDLLPEIRRQTIESLANKNISFTTRLNHVNAERILDTIVSHPKFGEFATAFQVFRDSANLRDTEATAARLTAAIGEPAGEIALQLQAIKTVHEQRLLDFYMKRRLRQESIMGSSIERMTEVRFDSTNLHRTALLEFIVLKMDTSLSSEVGSWSTVFSGNYPDAPPAFTDGIGSTVRWLSSDLGPHVERALRLGACSSLEARLGK